MRVTERGIELQECYRILEIKATATHEELRTAYRQQVKQWHPDQFGGNVLLRSAAEERLRSINLAYDTLRRSGLHPEGSPAAEPARPKAQPAPEPQQEPQSQQFRVLNERAPLDRDETIPASDPRCDLEPRQFSTGWGYVNEKQYTVIPGQFGAARPFAEGLAAVGTGRFASMAKYGYIDASGEFKVPVQFDDARDFHQGRAAVRMHTRWGFIDTKGSWIIPPRLQAAQDFSGGYAAVKEGGRWGYIDQQGRYLVTPQFSEAGPFVGGYAVAKLNLRHVKIDTAGEIWLYQITAR